MDSAILLYDGVCGLCNRGVQFVLRHDAVAEAAVVGRPDELKGQAISAFVTLEQGRQPTNELKEELRKWVAKEIGALAKPDDIRFTDTLPKTRSGKIMLAPPAIEAVRQWKYEPFKSDDRPVEVETIVRVAFRMPEGSEISGPRAARPDSPQPVDIPELVRVSAGVMQGLLDHRVDPEYPTDAKEKHIEGTVVLNVDIDNEGEVARLELVSGHPQLAAAAIDAVLQWKYRPFVLNGEAVAVETTVPVKFALAGE